MTKMKKKIKPSIKQMVRYQALLILMQVRNNQAYSNLMIQKANVSDLDRKLLSEIVYGTISRRYTLEYQLQQVTAGKKIDDWVKELLLLSIYQMKYLTQVPDHAILNDAVTIAKACGNEGIGKFVNGVLRNLQRQGFKPVIEKDPIKKLSIEASMPESLLRFLIEQYDFKTIEKMAHSLLTPSHVSARMTHLEDNRAQMIKQLREENFEVKESPVSPYGIIGEKGFLASSSPFKNGQLTIQDESSMLVAPALQVKPYHRVLDACAAPGGKTTHIASYLSSEEGGQVVALDIHPHKQKLIEENVARLSQEDVVQTKVLDAREVQSQFEDESFDRILIDAPCSGLGLMRRKPDIKYTKTIEALRSLATIQRDILESCAPVLKKGGLLIYSTCTFNKEENEAVVLDFLSRHPEFEKRPIAGSETVKDSVHDDMLTLLPHEYYTDGFFISCLVKKG